MTYDEPKSSSDARVDQHVDDLMELFQNPNSDSVPPVLKKAWPSI